MTGYGCGAVRDDRLDLTVEARSVNHRFLDIAWHYPRVYAPLEARMKQMVSRHFARGRIDIRITPGENGHPTRTVTADFSLAQQYYDALRELQYRLGAPGSVDMGLLVGLRDVLKVSEAVPADMENDWPLIAQGLSEALDALKTARLQEGAFLRQDLGARMEVLGQLVTQIRTRLPQVVQDHHKRLEQRVKEWFSAVELDAARLVQEAVMVAERGDITEELTRLEAHLQAMNQRRATLDCGRDMDRFGHLFQVRALLEAVLSVGVDAVRALDGVCHSEGNEAFLSLAERARLEHGTVPSVELLPELWSVRSHFGKARQVLLTVVFGHCSDALSRQPRCWPP